MSKSILYRIFGSGGIPKEMLPIIRAEGIVLKDEGISGSVIFRKFRAPGKRYSYRRTWFCGSLVITAKHFLAFQFSKPIIGVPLDDTRLRDLHCSYRDEDTLCVEFDVSVFHEGWSGTIECRFFTPRARLFLEQITTKQEEVLK